MVDLKKLKWTNPDIPPKLGKRDLTEDEFVWLCQNGHFPKKPNVQKTEADIARQYAKIIMDKQRTRGMMSQKFSDLKSKETINKELWMDTDFFFSVVFQSKQQKYDFLSFFFDKFNMNFETESTGGIQIINGVKLAEGLGCPLKKEVAADYPCGNIDLREFILDEERK